ncbi:hypothetical protein L1887_57363 [Cichorium endivia]|nr:hypothetical protein L1887_57363 [Cichorium endivia]
MFRLCSTTCVVKLFLICVDTKQMINSGEAASHADGVVMLGHVGCVEARESMDGRGSWRRRWLRSGCKTVSVAKVKKGGGAVGGGSGHVEAQANVEMESPLGGEGSGNQAGHLIQGG